jgi:hypothetical protein
MLNFDSFRKVGKYEISNTCLHTYPCQHIIKYEKETKLMFADKIYRLFKSEGLFDEHIDSYSEWVRQRDFPTPEEIKERKNNIIKNHQASENRAIEEAERVKIVDQYKASSRLEKLKNKNNIIKQDLNIE